jgi:predicted lactoylglutathione lyase
VRMMFVNLPVRDLAQSRAFFGALGFSFNEDFSNARAACLVVEQNVCVMLLTHDHFRTFIKGDIADPANGVAALLCFSAESRDAVDALLAKALGAGGKTWLPALQEGGMYGVSFQDLDGYVWEVLQMGGPVAASSAPNP